MLLRVLVPSIDFVVSSKLNRIVVMGKDAFYAVGVGRKRGVYETWMECKAQVHGIFNAKYKKFNTLEEAQAFVTSCITPTSSPTKTTPQSSPEKNRTQIFLSQPQELQKRLLAVGSQAVASEAKRPRIHSLSQPSTSAKSLFPATTATNDLQEQLDGLKRKTQVIEEDLRNFKEQKSRELEIIKAEICRIEETISQNSSEPTNDNGMQLNMAKKTKPQKNQLEPQAGPSSRSDSVGPEPTEPAGSLEDKVAKVKKRVKTERQAVKVEPLLEDPEVINIQPRFVNGNLISHEGEEIPLIFDKDGYCVVYTDGCCLNNGRPNARAGVGVWFGDNSKLNLSDPLTGVCRPTNNNAEIQAATLAMNIAKFSNIVKLNIHTDSNHAIQCVNDWMPRWQSNGWKTASGKPVANRDELEILLIAKQGLDVKWTLVPGHSNVHGNEEADRLANEGALRYTPSGNTY